MFVSVGYKFIVLQMTSPHVKVYVLCIPTINTKKIYN